MITNCKQKARSADYIQHFFTEVQMAH